MTEMTIDDQTFRYDPEATAAIYARLRAGWAEDCGCVGCRIYWPNEMKSIRLRLENCSGSLALTQTRKRRPSRMAPWRTDYTTMAVGSFSLVRWSRPVTAYLSSASRHTSDTLLPAVGPVPRSFAKDRGWASGSKPISNGF